MYKKVTVQRFVIIFIIINFAVAGPRLWNSLPAELRQPDIELVEFRRLLKTFLFTWDIGA